MARDLVALLVAASGANWEGVATAFATCLIALTGVIALIFAWQQLGQGRDQAKIAHLVNYDRDYRSDAMLRCRERLAKDCRSGLNDPPSLGPLLDFFDTIGLLEQKGYLNTYEVWSTFGYTVLIIFGQFESLLRDWQREDKTSYTDFIELAERMRRVEKKHGGPSAYPTQEELTDYWQAEIDEISAGNKAPRKRRKGRNRLTRAETHSSESN